MVGVSSRNHTKKDVKSSSKAKPRSKHKAVHAAPSKKTASSHAPAKAKHPHHKSKNSSHKPAAPRHYGKKFCPQCGNIITGSHSLCEDCRTTEFNFKNIKIFVCNNCKSYNHKNKWQKFTSLNDAIEHVLEDSIKHKFKFVHLNKDEADSLLSFKAGVHKDITLTVTINHERFDLPANFDVTLCPKCAKQGTKYFEGILQARNITDEIIKFIKNDAAKQKSKGVHINKEVHIEGEGRNIDYYYSDKRHLKVIAEKLRSHFGATIKGNAQLFSIDWETSKNLYRLNVLVDFPKYSKNDVLKINSQLFLIVSMDEKIHVMNLETATKTLLPHKDAYEILRPVEVMLIKKYPEVEVLDPTTYYQARLMNPDEKLQINQKIKVIIDGGEAWLVKG